MNLPFLKARRTPRIKVDGLPDEKMINGPDDDVIDAHLCSELMKACEEKDAKKFRLALEALVLNAFEDDGDYDDAA